MGQSCTSKHGDRPGARLQPVESDGERETASNDTVIVVSADGTICSTPSGSGLPSAHSAALLAGSKIEALWPDELAAAVRENIKRALRDRQVHFDKLNDADRDRQYEFVFVVQGRDRVLIVARDISQQQDIIEKLQDLAYIDKVTGLPNRSHLFKKLNEIVCNLNLRGGRAALIRIEINDLHLACNLSDKNTRDDLLTGLAMRLRHGLRSANQQGEENDDRFSIVARMDDNQFAVVLPAIDTGADAVGVASRLSDLLQQPVKIGDREVCITVSVGIALFPQDGTDAETLIDNAGGALEDAKNSQTQRQILHSGTVKMRALQRQDLTLELESALDREEFVLNFQPIVRAEDRDVTAVEVLLRLPSAVPGIKSIQELISLAEYTGLIIRLGEWALRRSCEQLHIWQDSGHSNLHLSVNLSAQEFSRSDLCQRIAGIIDDSLIEPRFLNLEINEHILLRDAMRDFAMCRELKELGVGLTVDDFGTGACSLLHLSRSPVDAVKIDCSLVAQLLANPNDRAACAAATTMAHELSLKVTAKCVETAEQATLLEQLGCDYLQGFLFLKPSSSSEIGTYLDRATGEDKFI